MFYRCTIKIREVTNLIECTWIRYMITIKRERNEPAGEWSERGFSKNFFNDSWDTTNERTKLRLSRLVENMGIMNY